MSVRIQESPDLWVVVSALEIIEARLGIIVIPSVPYRIDICNVCSAYDRVAACIGNRKKFSPCVINIVCDDCIILVANRNNVALQVFEEIILLSGCSVKVLDSVNCAVFIIAVKQILTAPCFLDDPAAFGDIGMRDAANRFGCTDSVSIVSIRGCYAAFYRTCKLSSLLPCERITIAVIIAQRITVCIVGNGVSVVFGKKIAPVGIGISIVNDASITDNSVVVVIYYSFGYISRKIVDIFFFGADQRCIIIFCY